MIQSVYLSDDIGNCSNPIQTCDTHGNFPCSDTLSGNLFLVIVYSLILASGAKLINLGSEKLMRIVDPGVIGGFVLPVLGALPDAAIIFVSALGSDRDVVQNQLSVGMGTLAGSNVLLLTLPLAGTIWWGRCDVVNDNAKNKTYSKFSWRYSGITVSKDVKTISKIMIVTVLPYLIIQGVFVMTRVNEIEDIAQAEGDWALGTFILCCIGFVAYSLYQILDVTFQQRRLETARKQFIWRKFLERLGQQIRHQAKVHIHRGLGTFEQSNPLAIDRSFHSTSSSRRTRSRSRIRDDEPSRSRSATPARVPVTINVAEEAESISSHQSLISQEHLRSTPGTTIVPKIKQKSFFGFEEVHIPLRIDAGVSGAHNLRRAFLNVAPDKFFMRQIFTAWREGLELLEDEEESQEEDEEVTIRFPGEKEESTVPILENAISPKQKFITHRRRTAFKAITFCLLGTFIVLFFADPMVESIANLGDMINLSPFYISFIVTPIASNSAELFNSYYFALKKSKKPLSLNVSSLYGAVCMNNTISLGVFLGMIYFRNLKWYFSAETLIIFLIVTIVGLIGSFRTTYRLYYILVYILLYPLSILLVVFLESSYIGWN